MKKTILTIALCSLAAGVYAQKSKINTARDYLSDNNYRKALPELDAAVASDETKNNADAWFYRGHAYLMQAMDTSAKNPAALDEAMRSFNKTVELKPGYDPDRYSADIQNLMIVAYNDAIAIYNTADYNKAYDRFMMVYNIYNTNSKRLAGNVKIKELAVVAKQNAANCALNAKRDDEALRLLLEIKDEQTPKDSNTYYSIIEILERQKKYDQLITVLNEAGPMFPNNKMIRNSEINYYINTGKTDQLLPKLESSVAADAGNADLHFMIGNIYEKISFPKNGTAAADRPANAAESFSKSEAAYKKALAISPDNPDYNYNLGVLYYETAVDYNRQMNNIKGTSPAETKKYDNLLAQRNSQFGLALPYFEKAYNNLSAREASLTPDERVVYTQVITGMLEIYSRQNNKAKTEELRKKLAALR